MTLRLFHSWRYTDEEHRVCERCHKEQTLVVEWCPRCGGDGWVYKVAHTPRVGHSADSGDSGEQEYLIETSLNSTEYNQDACGHCEGSGKVKVWRKT